MTDIGVVLNSIRNSFSYLWSEYGFKLNRIETNRRLPVQRL